MNAPIRVLYVDDSPLDRDLVRDVLGQERGGFRLTEAAARADFEAQLADGEYDIVLSDFHLPGFDGLQVLDAVQARDPRLPVVIVTGTGSEEIAVTAMKRGAADYVLKSPRSIQRLPQTIHAVLERKHLHEERERAEAALRESEKRFRALIENSSDAVSLLNADGIIQYASPAATRILGYASDELVGQNLFALMHPDEVQFGREALAELLEKPEANVTLQVRLQHKEGAWRWVEAIGANLLTEPGVQAIVVNYRDITERKQRGRELEAITTTSAALRLARTRAEMLSVVLDQVLFWLDADGALLDTHDLASGEMVAELGRGAWAHVTGQRTPPGEGLSLRVMVTGQPYVTADVLAEPRVVRPDLIGNLRTVACAPLIAQRQPIGVLWIGRTGPNGPAPHPITVEDLRLLTAIADIAANALHRVALHEETERRLQHLAALRAIDLAISASLDLRVTLHVLLEQVTSQLRVDAADVLLRQAHTHILEYAAGRGFRSRAVEHSRVRLGEGYAGRAALERSTLSLPNLAEEEPDFGRAPLLAGEDFGAYYAAPLVVKGEVLGVLEIFHRAPFTADTVWLEFLETLARQAAIALENALLFDDLQRSNINLALAYDATLEGWSRALDLRDKETEGHTRRVTEMTMRLARALGVSEAEVVHFQRGALLHDIGKMGIPDSILHKPGPLTDEEWAIMRRHPTYAYELLSPTIYLRPALDIPYCHHEKWDGTGYPRGLKGEQIPLAARIFAVADVWDALRSDRPYRAGWPAETVLEYIREQAGKHFDPKVAEVFLALDGKVRE